jgi:DNA primase large subunit
MLKSGANTIPLYDQPPNGTISLDDLETLITTRMFLLDTVEASIHKKDEKFNSLKIILNDKNQLIGWPEKVDNDIASHYVLATAFCKTDQERTWFANLEAKLFLIRLDQLKADLFGVLNMLNIPLENQDNLSNDLLAKVKFKQGENELAIYRIPFEYALNLLPTMQYFIYQGFIYITKNEIPQIIESVFRENILRKLNLMYKNINKITNDKRISYLIKNLQMKREGKFKAKIS